MAANDPLIDFFFAGADAMQSFLVTQGVLPATLDLTLFFVVVAMSICLYVPICFVQWLCFKEHGPVPVLDVPLTAEELQENVDKKWVRLRCGTVSGRPPGAQLCGSALS